MYTIYQITNKKNKKKYIGYTTKFNPELRFHEHVNSMNAGSKYYLHNAIRKYGKRNFTFTILEQGENELFGLNVSEPLYIKWMNPEYNMTHGGEGAKHINPSNKGKAREDISRLFKGQPKSKEHRYKISKALIGIHRPQRKQEHQKKLNQSHKKQYQVIDPTGQSQIITGLNDFCLSNNLNPSLMCNVAAGRRKQHKGWKCELL